MKKILALVLAVVMLASMATTAMATPSSPGVIRFVVDGIENLPTPPGIFCPVAQGPNPGPQHGGWYGRHLSFLNNYGSINLNFGHWTVPPLTPGGASPSQITFRAVDGIGGPRTSMGNNNRVGTPLVPHERTLGMGMQAWIYDLDPFPGNLPPSFVADQGVSGWSIHVTLFDFNVGGVPGNPTLDDFRLDLSLNQTTPRHPQNYPNSPPLSFGPAGDWNVASMAGPGPGPASGLTQSGHRPTTPLSQWDTRMAVAAGPLAVFGWEWNAELTGTSQIIGAGASARHNIPHPSSATTQAAAQAELFWEFVFA